ncbi:MAG: exodeoxyribonuclease VII large subunit [Gemmatimonadaceae bacterium]
MRNARRPSRQWGSSQNFDMFGAEIGIPSGIPVITKVVVPGGSPESAVSVASLTETARAVIEGALPPLWVRGEVSDFKRHRNGHWYFCLRDGAAQVRCVVWSRGQRLIPTSPDDGMEVSAYGQLTVYAARGDLHLNVTAMEARGDGLWLKALEETRLRLHSDGLLAPERKRVLPAAPLSVGVVTSPDGAALRDIIAAIRRRAPHITIVVSATAVQGVSAPSQICDAIDRMCRWGGADVIIIGRGGGAREDLWAFNDEQVARAIAAAPVPIISGVGHETDITIADLVADHRAATPSAAAEAAVPVRSEMLGALRSTAAALQGAMDSRIAYARGDLQNAADMLRRNAELDVERRRAGIAATAGRLNALSPLATLSRGYAVARDAVDRRTLAQVADFGPDRLFTLTLRDGDIVARPVARENA